MCTGVRNLRACTRVSLRPIPQWAALEGCTAVALMAEHEDAKCHAFYTSPLALGTRKVNFFFCPCLILWRRSRRRRFKQTNMQQANAESPQGLTGRLNRAVASLLTTAVKSRHDLDGWSFFLYVFCSTEKNSRCVPIDTFWPSCVLETSTSTFAKRLV